MSEYVYNIFNSITRPAQAAMTLDRVAGKINSSREIEVCGAGDVAHGIIRLINDVSAAGDPVTLEANGYPLALLGADSLTAGMKLTPESGGRLIEATAGQPYSFILLADGDDGDERPVQFAKDASGAHQAAEATIVALTDSTGSGSHDDTIADGLTATSPSAITNYDAVTNMTDPVTKAEGEAVSAALATLENEVTALRATVDALVTDATVQNQNDSDLAQKILEIRTALINYGVIAAA
ncbi:MAG TPA: hypothetical protein VMO47_09145 [Rhodothermales bacterium]|nr:hypothetical protein [Rhodothermales bacterium]